MLALLVKGENGNYILASDAVYSKAIMGRRHRWQVYVSMRRDITELLKNQSNFEVNNAEVFFGHDMNQFKELQKRYASGTL